MRTLRAILLLTLSLSVASIMLPSPAQAISQPTKKCCHSHVAQSATANGKIDNGCDEPAKPQDRPCCAGCAMCFALIATSGQRFIFPKRDADRFGDADTQQLSRADRPPVPPPRA